MGKEKPFKMKNSPFFILSKSVVFITKKYISREKGIHHEKPKCFRCGDCCIRVPVEVTEKEIKLILLHLNTKEKSLFLAQSAEPATNATKYKHTSCAQNATVGHTAQQ